MACQLISTEQPMNRQFWSGLTTTTLTTTFGTAVFLSSSLTGILTAKANAEPAANQPPIPPTELTEAAANQPATDFLNSQPKPSPQPAKVEAKASKFAKASILTSQAVKNQVKGRKKGRASWYGPGFHGKRTASGERFNQNALTAAHRSLPFGTKVKVTNSRNGRSVIVRINDRGPFHGGRIIDLSKAAARVLGIGGTAPVILEVLGR